MDEDSRKWPNLKIAVISTTQLQAPNFIPRLDRLILAEGVETDEQWLRLQAVGCSEIQGFVAASPMAAGDLSERLTTSTPYSTAHAQA